MTHSKLESEWFELCRHGSIIDVKEFLDKNKQWDARGTRDDDKKACLHIAAEEGNTHVVEFLWKQFYKDYGVPISHDGLSPLFFAVCNGHIDTCMFLLEQLNLNTSYDFISRNYNFFEKSSGKIVQTLLHIAAYNGYTTICALLIGYGANLEAKTVDVIGRTPLYIALKAGHLDTAKFLLKRGAKLDYETVGLLWKYINQ